MCWDTKEMKYPFMQEQHHLNNCGNRKKASKERIHNIFYSGSAITGLHPLSKNKRLLLLSCYRSITIVISQLKLTHNSQGSNALKTKT